MENTNELKQNKMGTAPLFRLIMSDGTACYVFDASPSIV